jgi:hypothetical protein
MKWTLLLLCFCIALRAEEVPLWVMKGILRVESSSYYDSEGNIRYVDRKVGRAGELGPFQITRVAYLQVKRKGEPDFRYLQNNAKLSEAIAIRYLLWLRKNYASNWYEAIGMYNAGPGRKSPSYVKKVVQ